MKYGTVNWELSTLKALKLDQKKGFNLSVQEFASSGATQIALKSKAVDIIVSDWFWVNLQRSRGELLQFTPYSSAIGSVMVQKNASIQSLDDLKGKRIGIAGGPLSKGWVLLQAVAKSKGWDIKADTQQTYAAPPLLNQSLIRGRIDAVITFWHYGARLEAAGLRHLVDLKELQRTLGMKSEIPMLGYVFHENWAKKHPALLQSFQDSIVETKQALKEQPALWKSIQHLSKAKDEKELSILSSAYIKGIPEPLGDNHVEEAERFYQLIQQAAPEFANTKFHHGSFWNPHAP